MLQSQENIWKKYYNENVFGKTKQITYEYSQKLAILWKCVCFIRLVYTIRTKMKSNTDDERDNISLKHR